MSSTDLTMQEIVNMILRRLKEATTTTAFPTGTLASPGLVLDTVNDFYEEIFNQPNKQKGLREKAYEFITIADTTLNGALVPGGLSIVIDGDASDYPSTGQLLIDQEFIPYTANDGVHTFTCAASAISQNHDDGSTVRYTYPLPSDCDKEKILSLNIDGLPYDSVGYEKMLDVYENHDRTFGIFKGYLILPEDATVYNAIMTYSIVVARLDLAGVPSLIPNQWRSALLVNGPLGRLMFDDGQAGYERYWRPSENQRDKGGGLYYDNLRKFYASYGRRTDTNKKTVRSVYD
jgi:hypothetical protein